MSAAPAAMRAAHAVVARLRTDLASPPEPLPALRAPREAAAPPPLIPPQPGTRDPAAARVIASWVFHATHLPRLGSPFTWRGKRAALTTPWLGA